MTFCQLPSWYSEKTIKVIAEHELYGIVLKRTREPVTPGFMQESDYSVLVAVLLDGELFCLSVTTQRSPEV